MGMDVPVPQRIIGLAKHVHVIAVCPGHRVLPEQEVSFLRGQGQETHRSKDDRSGQLLAEVLGLFQLRLEFRFREGQDIHHHAQHLWVLQGGPGKPTPPRVQAGHLGGNAPPQGLPGGAEFVHALQMPPQVVQVRVQPVLAEPFADTLQIGEQDVLLHLPVDRRMQDPVRMQEPHVHGLFQCNALFKKMLPRAGPGGGGNGPL